MISAETGGGLPRRARFGLVIVLFLLVVLTWHRYMQVPERPFVAFNGSAMGTTWSVKVAAEHVDAAAERAIGAAIAARIERVNQLMSTWQPDSELSRFNQHDAHDPFAIAPETLRVFQVAHEVSLASDGAFDVTVGPLVRAWGFGVDAVLTAPSSDDLSALKQRVGFDKVAIDASAGTLTKARADVSCDLSAVAKGYAVDQVAESLSGLGYQNYLVEIGGELRARGGHLDGAPWRVGIEEPDAGGRNVRRIVKLRDRALATSGDYRNVYELDGRPVAHIIDPRTGRPADHGLASVSVIHDEAAYADAWATALQVAGPEVGRSLALAQGLAAYFIVRRADAEFESFMTPSFEPLLVR